MKIVIVSATTLEIPFFDDLQAAFSSTEIETDLLITGVGILESSYSLMQYLRTNHVDYILQLGIAGSFDTTIPLGTVVIVAKDRVADTIVKENGSYKDLEELQFQAPNTFPYTNGWLENAAVAHQDIYSLSGMYKIVLGVTVNEISTDPDKIAYFKHKYQATIESMEGAAMHYIALQASIPFLQIRGISNVVGDRNKQNWKIKAAITSLQTASSIILKRITAPLQNGGTLMPQ